MYIGTTLEGGNTYYYGENRYHSRYPWEKRNVDDDVELMRTIGEEDRCSVQANLSKRTGYTGISVLHRLHKLYGFDVIQDTVFDMMHNLPLNVVRKHIKRVIEEGKVDKNVLEHKLSLMPWTAGYAMKLLHRHDTPCQSEVIVVFSLICSWPLNTN